MTYTEASFDDASEVVDAAGLSNLLAIKKLEGGWANSNYVLTLDNSEKVVLKIWNEQSLEEVNYLLSVTSYLSEKGISTPSPMKFLDGGYIFIKNGLAWTLLPFIEGNWLQPTPDSLYSLGRAQAELHLLDPPSILRTDFSMGYKLFEKLFKIADESGEWSEFLYLLKTESTLLMSTIGELPKGIIHGDLFPDNVIGSSEEVRAILDFEEVSYDILAFDLAMTFVGFGWLEGEPVAERWNSILSGYQSVRTLNSDEVKALPALHRLATLSIAAWRYWQFVINLPDTENTDRYLEMTKRLNKELPF